MSKWKLMKLWSKWSYKSENKREKDSVQRILSIAKVNEVTNLKIKEKRFCTKNIIYCIKSQYIECKKISVCYSSDKR